MPTLRLPASIAGLTTTSLTVRKWLKTAGGSVSAGEVVVELEAESGLVQIEAPVAGVLGAIVAAAGATVTPGAVLGELTAGAVTAEPAKPSNASPAAASKEAAVSTTPSGNVIPVLMPQAGNSMEEGRVVSWKVKEGDRIKVGQIIMEVETDKATVEVEATDAGRLARIVAREGDVVPVKQPVAYLAENDADLGDLGGSQKSEAGSQKGTGAATVAGSGSAVPVLMPQAGNTMEEGTILKWRVKEGDRVTVGQILYEVETDKASVEVEATDAGRIAKIVAQEGDVVPVKQPVAWLAENDADLAGIEDGSQKPEASGQKAATASPTVATSAPAVPVGGSAGVAAGRSDGGRVKASPAARKLARERGLDLASVATGSGPGGRVLSTDLAGAKAAGAGAAVTVPPAPRSNEVIRRPMSKMRKAIAVNLQQSKATVPHFYVKLTINADALFTYYKAQKATTGCTLNDVVLLAVGKTVGDFAAFRSRVDGNDIVEMPTANIGVAVSVADGLVVPVVMNVDRMALAQLAAESKRVVEAARAGKIENMGKGVFTISNMGMLGVEEFSAIINPPESGILAIAGVRETVIVKDGAMRPGRVMTMTLSVDHRVVDGALAAAFVAKLKERLEAPETI